ncbi:MAG: hypothetical protein Q3982_07885 [Phoenicibacter congonensis]|uniref:Uncharacterized protein n=1 Tax=Phoenicibacter congonensis TaxID=1944646 RepID=A0AA43UAK8_9ACTN|nr:hypothetical protein [Phoenicibacter congonensis]
MPWYKHKKLVYGCVAGVCCVALIGGGVAIALNQSSDNNKENETTTLTVSYKEDTGIKVNVDLPDWNDDSTPALLEINDGVSSTYQVIESKNAKDIKIALNKGDYTIKLISPINSDGSIYFVSDEVKATINDNNKEVKIPINGSKLPAEDVTDDQIKDIQKKFDEAKELGKVDQSTVDKVNKNADAGKDARESKSDDEKKEAQETAKEEVKKTETTGSTSSQSSSTSSPSSSSSSGSSGSSSSASFSTHTHNWIAHYSTIYHDAVTTQTPIYSEREVVYCNNCGADITNNYSQHTKAHALAGETGGWSVKTETEMIGYETTTITPAYEETVVDYYYCSCGATK